MGKAADLSDFDRGQIVMARRLGTSISETARLLGCSRSTLVSIYAKWINDGETSSRRHGVGRLHAIKEKGHRILSRMVKQNRSQTVAQLTAQ
ncbi:HTH_Tnp_Tc3_2 domain-containing protein [Trichonephila clavipes]|nr:HTH_Tnp_Tc3_2 domain-containing protein [Trichonephila clavipes]